jgi:Fe-S cluster biogenesis protein NfuA
MGNAKQNQNENQNQNQGHNLSQNSSSFQEASGSTTRVSFENTPNPATLKFNLPFEVTVVGFDCPTAQESDRSPLASKIFGFPWTQSVFVGPNYITVTKQDWVEWNVLAEPLAGLIQEHLDRGEPVVVEVTGLDENEDSALDSPLVKEIKALLNREIRPVVALDGGDISFAKLEGEVLSIRMKGACSGCPSSQATLKEGIEVRIRQAFPQIREVIAI